MENNLSFLVQWPLNKSRYTTEKTLHKKHRNNSTTKLRRLRIEVATGKKFSVFMGWKYWLWKTNSGVVIYKGLTITCWVAGLLWVTNKNTLGETSHFIFSRLINRLRIKCYVPPRIFLFVTHNKPGSPVYYIFFQEDFLPLFFVMSRLMARIIIIFL